MVRFRLEAMRAGSDGTRLRQILILGTPLQSQIASSQPLPAMPSATYALFRNAILAEQQVVCLYDGRRRELCPHIIGTSKSGEEVVLAWQFFGERSGKLPQWRWLKLANFSDPPVRGARC